MEEYLFGIIKNSTAVKRIARDIEADVSRAYLFTSEDELALDSFLLYAELKTYCNDVCLKCSECKKVIDKTKPDIKVLDAEEKVSVKDIEKIIEDGYLGAFEGGKKIYVIKNFNKLSETAQNKLLKSLEEPQDGVSYLLTASSAYGILTTVLSRVKHITIPKFTAKELHLFLKSKGIADNGEFSACADGNASLALRLAQDEEFFIKAERVANIIKNVKGSASVPRFLNDSIFKDLKEALFFAERILRDVLYIIGGASFAITLKSLTPIYEEIAKELNIPAISEIMNEITVSEQKIGASCASINIIDCLLLKIAEEKAKCKQ